MQQELMGVVAKLAREKNIKPEIILEALKTSLITAYKKNFGITSGLRITFDEGSWHVFITKKVVETVLEHRYEISLTDAKKINEAHEVSDEIEIEVTSKDFGRIAAQTAKQLVMQKIRDAERDVIFEEYSDKENDIVSGIVQRTNYKNVYVDLGNTEGILVRSETIPGEFYKVGERIKLDIISVEKHLKVLK